MGEHTSAAVPAIDFVDREARSWTRWGKAIGRFLRLHRLAAVGAFIVIAFLVLGALAPWVAPKDPNAISPQDGLRVPSREFLLGTDYLGRDLLSRIIFGARISLLVSFSAVSLAAAGGVSLGTLAGWYRWLETPLMRMVDVMLCFPGIIVALAIISILGSGIENVVVAVAIGQLPEFARLAHGLTLSVKENAYVEAAICLGVSDLQILRRHILPNIVAPIIVQVSLLIPSAILTTAALSFLGLGVAPPTPEWGSMLQDSMKWARIAPHVMIFPGLALTLVVFGYNTFGDGLRSALDPRLRRRR